MSLQKLWFIRNPVLVSYSICVQQGSSNLSGSQSALTCMCVCARAQMGLREFNNEWVKFRDTEAKFPVSKIQLGNDLGAAIDIGPAMMRNILKQNGSVMYRSSVRPLTQDEIQSPTEKKAREEFAIAIEDKFGPAMKKDDFQNDPDYTGFVTLTYDCYEDDEVSP
jgi:hypothetical protein